MTTRISPYHDGEVSGTERIAIEAHLGECEQCRTELEMLRALSRAMMSLQAPAWGNPAKQRLHTTIAQSQLRLIERLAGALGAMAAMVAIAAVLWSNSASNTATAANSPEQWEQAAVQLTAIDTTAEISTAEWVLKGLTQGDSNVE